MSNPNVTPFVKWAGGKRQLLDHIKARMPEKFNKYIEPFVGGGAVAFELMPQDALLNDINEALINTYTQIRDVPEQFLEQVQAMDQGLEGDAKEYYYTLRQRYNDKLMRSEYDTELAALFVFINKHCFNGLYRVNGKGLFNVPYNKSKKSSVEPENILETSKYLKTVQIVSGDFERVCQLAEPGDFLFLDSPYAPLNENSFEAYTKEGFDAESHRRLARIYHELTERGCYCMLTNHNTKFIMDLYQDRGYAIDVVSVKRMINSDASKRTGEEVIICNY